MVRYVWLYQPWPLAALCPIKFSAIDDHTTNGSSVSTDELCSRMYHNICAVLNRADQIRSRECIVNNQRNSMLVCNSCDLFNINHFRVWISKCLYLDGFGVILNCSFNLFIVERIYKCCLNAIIRKRMCQKVVGTTVDILCSYNVIPCMRNCLKCIS